MTQTVAVFGATGAQGAPVVAQARARGMTVRAVARDKKRVSQMHPDAKPFTAALGDKDAIATALDGVDAAFLHLPIPAGPDDIQTWMAAFLGAAHQVALPLLVFTTGGPTGDRYPSSVVVDAGTAGMKGLLASGIPTIVLRPALYLENLLPPMFAPSLRDRGILDYPPFAADLKVQWTSHQDQARIAVAAMARPDLAGRHFEIGTPDALTGPELAALVSGWLGRDVRFDPITPAQFGERVGDALGNPAAGFALTDLYGSIAKLRGDEMAIDTNALEKTFDVQLVQVADHIMHWQTGG
ncbi:MAG: NmrA family NAD(P)-binding protein [Roseitalea sp.]|nr:NmrA family NAD(P)-binding protein [Roseitalea sp.]MBO6721521.1 NmrA family NAD(P)-binding protein [Roseitalea sp.]MBO6742078.1 NmrA family NAD(P)-binding protein [Roseitalea sp.]